MDLWENCLDEEELAAVVDAAEAVDAVLQAGVAGAAEVALALGAVDEADLAEVAATVLASTVADMPGPSTALKPPQRMVDDNEMLTDEYIAYFKAFEEEFERQQKRQQEEWARDLRFRTPARTPTPEPPPPVCDGDYCPVVERDLESLRREFFYGSYACREMWCSQPRNSMEWEACNEALRQAVDEEPMIEADFWAALAAEQAYMERQLQDFDWWGLRLEQERRAAKRIRLS